MNESSEDSLQALVLEATRKAQAAGALVPIETHARVIEEAGQRLEVRHASALGLKDLTRAIRGGGEPGAAPVNPFLPYEEALFVADVPAIKVGAGSSHVLLLNKFPVIDEHVLLITRDYQEQLAMLAAPDFIALAWMLSRLDGLLFYNGGPLGGASLPHRHFQWVPSSALTLAPALAQAADEGEVPGLPFRHAFVRHGFDDSTNGAEALSSAFLRATSLMKIDPNAPMLPPCNLLLTREWLLLVPRTREHWEGDGVSVSINALGFAGSVLVRSPEHIDPLVNHGVLRVLDSVTR